MFAAPLAEAIFQRQPYGESRTEPESAALGGDRPTVCLDELTDDREPEAEAAVAPARAGVAAAEAIERVRQKLSIHTDAGVADVDADH